MRINNYQGTVADRPIDTVVVEPDVPQQPQMPMQGANYMDKILAQYKNQNQIVPAGNLPVYNKG